MRVFTVSFALYALWMVDTALSFGLTPILTRSALMSTSLGVSGDNDVETLPAKGKSMVIAGATGYIGKSTVRESVVSTG